MFSLFKKPSAWIPVAASFVVLATMLLIIALSGPPVRQSDEGVGAHLFQIWLFLEVLAAGFFAVKWLPQKPRQALLILGIQILAILAACAPVFILKL